MNHNNSQQVAGEYPNGQYIQNSIQIGRTPVSTSPTTPAYTSASSSTPAYTSASPTTPAYTTTSTYNPMDGPRMYTTQVEAQRPAPIAEDLVVHIPTKTLPDGSRLIVSHEKPKKVGLTTQDISSLKKDIDEKYQNVLLAYLQNECKYKDDALLKQFYDVLIQKFTVETHAKNPKTVMKRVIMPYMNGFLNIIKCLQDKVKAQYTFNTETHLHNRITVLINNIIKNNKLKITKKQTKRLCEHIDCIARGERLEKCNEKGEIKGGFTKKRVTKRRVSKRRLSKRRVSKRRVSKRRVSKRRLS